MMARRGGMAARVGRGAAAAAAPAAAGRQRAAGVRARAAPPGGGGGPGGGGPGGKKKSSPPPAAGGDWFERVVRSQMDESRARRVQKVLREVGVDSPEKLRGLFRQGTWKALAPRLQTLVLSAAAVALAATTYQSISGMDGLEPLPLRRVVQFVTIVGGGSYLLDFLGELGVVASAAASSVLYGINASAYLKLLEEMAPEERGGNAGAAGAAASVLSRTERIKATRAAVELSSKLAALAEDLKALSEQGLAEEAGDTLASLSQLFLASEIDASRYSFSKEEISRVAKVFYSFDENRDGSLQAGELQDLASQLGLSLDGPELEQALKVLDSDGNGTVEFSEFLEFLEGKCPSGLPVSGQLD